MFENQRYFQFIQYDLHLIIPEFKYWLLLDRTVRCSLVYIWLPDQLGKVESVKAARFLQRYSCLTFLTFLAPIVLAAEKCEGDETPEWRGVKLLADWFSPVQ